MGLEQGDASKAIAESMIIFAEGEPRKVRITLRTANRLRQTLVLASAIVGNENDQEKNQAISRRLESVMPEGILRDFGDGYNGDLEEEVETDFTYKEVDLVGRPMLTLPSAEQVMTAKSARFNGIFLLVYMIGLQQAFLDLHASFVKAGGKDNAQMREKVEQLIYGSRRV